MTKFRIVYPKGATPIDPDEAKDLIPDYISTMGELNQVEQSNIADAFVWVEKQDHGELLTGTFVFKLHEQMFNQVWKWAGKTRRSNNLFAVVLWRERFRFSEQHVVPILRLQNGSLTSQLKISSSLRKDLE